MATRLEKVILDLEDRFTDKIVKATVATKVFDKALADLDGSLTKSDKSMDRSAKGVDKFSDSTRRGGKELDSYTSRLRLIGQIAATLGPGLVPIGAVAVPAVATLAAGLGALALAGGSAIAAFQGVGDATKALDEYDAAPTAENLTKAQEAMAKLGPDAQAFTRAFQDFQPVLTDIRDSAAAGLFPGLTESLDNFEKVGPRVASIFEAVGEASGNAVRDFSEELAGPRYAEFLAFLETAAPAAITSMARSLSDVTHGVTQLMRSLNPGIEGGFGWIEDVANGFDRWASSANGRKDIEGFLAYVRETGPQVQELFTSLVGALSALAQAAAPLGGPVLTALTGIAKAMDVIVSSPLGTPIIAAVGALAVYNRSMAAALALQTKFNLGATTTAAAGAAGGAATAGAGAAAAGAGAAGAAAKTTGLQKAALGVTAALVALPLATDIWDTGMRKVGDSSDGAVKSLDDLKSTLADSRLGKYAGDLGIDIDRLAEDMSKFGTQGDYYKETVSKLQEATGQGFGGNVKEFGNFLNVLTTGSTQQAKFALSDLTSVVDGNAEALDSAGNATAQAAARSRELAAAEAQSTAALTSATAALKARTEAALTAFGAETSYREALKAAQTQAQGNNKGINGMTDAALANRRALESLGNAWNSQSETVKNSEKRYESARQSFVQLAIGMGVPARQARKLANTMLDIPSAVKTDVSNNAAQAAAKVRQVQRAYSQLPDKAQTDIRTNGIPQTKAQVNSLIKRYDLTEGERKALMTLVDAAARANARSLDDLLNNVARDRSSTITITTVKKFAQDSIDFIAGRGIGSANGSIYAGGVKKFADGGGFGLSDGRAYKREPQIVQGGANILWAEPETRREAYISDKPGMRDRNLAILQETAGWFGATVTEYARGGTVNGKAASRGDGFAMFADSLGRSLKDLEKALDRNKSALDKARETRTSYASSVTDNLRSDPFGMSIDPWSGAGNDPLSVLRQDIANAGEFSKLRASLGNRVKGAALNEVDTLAEARTLAAYSPAQQREYARLYAQRQSITASAGSAAGYAAYGNESRQVAELQKLQVEVRMLRRENKKNSDDNAEKTGQRVGGAVNSAASSAQRRRPYSASFGG